MPAVRAAPMTPDLAALAARVMPAVVSVESTDPIGDNPADNGDGGDGGSVDPGRAAGPLSPAPVADLQDAAGSVLPPPKAEEALGAGFVFDPAGYILTNDHVISGASGVTVTFQDGTILPATVVGQDKDGDLAVLKVQAGHRLPALQFGDSAKLRVGDWVLAVGNPYGLSGSASAGIVSALHRDIGETRYDDFIQTDATINRGNSGGPLFNLQGQVIGVNSAIYSATGGSVGIGFAIPADMAAPVAAALQTNGQIVRGWLGLSAQAVTPEISQLLGLPGTGGALVGSVADTGPAAGRLQPGDVLVALGNRPVNDPRALMIRTAEIPAGQAAAVTFWRHGGLQTTSLSVAIPPPDQPPGTAPLAAAQPGVKIAALGLTAAAASSPDGAAVLAVMQGGPGAKAGLLAGNHIEAVSASQITSASGLQSSVEQLRDGHQPSATLLVSGDDASGNDPGPRWVGVMLSR